MLRGAAVLLLLTGSGAVQLEPAAREQEASAYVAELQRYTLADYARDFYRPYTPGSESWEMRRMVFRANMEKVIRVASKPGLTWTPGVTKFTDYTFGEYSRLLGYRGRHARDTEDATEMRAASADLVPLSQTPLTYNTLYNTTVASTVHDQGSCGSCWSEAALTTIEAAVEKSPAIMEELRNLASSPALSREFVGACTKNPLHCGGSGGCDGATAELAYKLIRDQGAPLDQHVATRGGPGGYAALGQFPECDTVVTEEGTPKLGIRSYTVLPKNRPRLRQALVTTGSPIAVAVDATNWGLYKAGVYSDVDVVQAGEFTVNHVATLVGYHAKDPYKDDDYAYYHIKNSWGTNFGENGYMRIEIKDGETEHCGWDTNTHMGVACDGEPNRAWVCGTNGILFDASYAVGPFIVH